jgi:hypothetical protein
MASCSDLTPENPRAAAARIEPMILPDERRDALAVTVCLPGIPANRGGGWMKTPKAIGPIADRDCGYHFILSRVDHTDVIGILVRDVNLAAVRGHGHTLRRSADGDHAYYVSDPASITARLLFAT